MDKRISNPDFDISSLKIHNHWINVLSPDIICMDRTLELIEKQKKWCF